MTKKPSSGLSFVELLIALTLSSFVVIGVQKLVMGQARQISAKIETSKIVRSSERARRMIEKDLLEAGFGIFPDSDVLWADGSTSVLSLEKATAKELILHFDYNQNGKIDLPSHPTKLIPPGWELPPGEKYERIHYFFHEDKLYRQTTFDPDSGPDADPIPGLATILVDHLNPEEAKFRVFEPFTEIDVRDPNMELTTNDLEGITEILVEWIQGIPKTRRVVKDPQTGEDKIQESTRTSQIKIKLGNRRLGKIGA